MQSLGIIRQKRKFAEIREHDFKEIFGNMKQKAGNIDFPGALASNAGDAFHEIWVLVKTPDLLDSTSRLTSLTVGGIPEANANRNNRSWDGVDCTPCHGESEEGPGKECGGLRGGKTWFRRRRRVDEVRERCGRNAETRR